MNYNEKYQKWVSKEDLDPTLKAELLSMDETAKEDAFYTDVEFGTAGMRGILGAGTNRLNIYVIQKANVGFAKYIASLPEGKERGVAIGYDNRHMSYKFAIESAKVLATYGIKSYIFESLRPTPELSFAVRYLKCAGGIMITASHNPKEHNGYKVYDDTGCQLLPEAADQVVQYVNEVEDELNIKVFSDEEAYPYMTWIGEEVDEAYYKEVMAIEVNPGMDKSDFKIVADFFAEKRLGRYNPKEHPEAICHVEAVLNLLQVFTNDETYVKIEKTVAERAKAGEVITMCTFAEEMTNKGIEIGEAQGIRIGEARGIAREKISVARNLLDLLTDDVIAEKVGLELATVKELREETK